jgi:hypothetical protein
LLIALFHASIVAEIWNLVKRNRELGRTFGVGASESIQSGGATFWSCCSGAYWH